MVTFAVFGMGNRGTRYAAEILKFPAEEAKVVAMADTRRVRLDAANKYLNLPESALFSSGEEMLKQDKLADIMIIATQDQQHVAHAIAAMERGYDLMLEKPIATTKEDCEKILETAHRCNRKVIVCHVLRYTAFYSEIRRIIREGIIGKVESIEAAENVGYYHQAHSYVRGNWHNEAKSSCMILAKCCHDMDIFLYLTGKKAKKITSFGSLDHFVLANAPAGSAERCADCKIKDCIYNAQNFYFSRMPGWPSNILHPEPTKENLTEILNTTDYGRCVYKMDNDVVDHQVTNILMEDGCTISHTMTAFNKKQTRTIHVYGTKGDIVGSSRDHDLEVRLYGGETYKVDVESKVAANSGHGGGDFGLIDNIIALYNGKPVEEGAISTIDRSMESHFMAFAAEKSRVNEGQVVDLDAFVKV